MSNPTLSLFEERDGGGCDQFRRGAPTESDGCPGDGHYQCPECVHFELRCPSCRAGQRAMLLDNDGVLASVSGKPGRPGHALSDYHWFCDDDHAAPNMEPGRVCWSCGTQPSAYANGWCGTCEIP